ncbi:hypothetical protein F5144DRAFT_282697 [Chaetomium tenue]|uniref:Uncharacterized protein n=1 Tax=Chaetomium tenue TaxID=1854479 RepID=A0ACB7P157_9PEZI|nr:hypothetical protein F5144DRAFT_282697 [Chaetomium globosum]
MRAWLCATYTTGSFRVSFGGLWVTHSESIHRYRSGLQDAWYIVIKSHMTNEVRLAQGGTSIHELIYSDAAQVVDGPAGDRTYRTAFGAYMPPLHCSSAQPKHEMVSPGFSVPSFELTTLNCRMHMWMGGR